MKRLRDVVCDFKRNKEKIQRMDNRYPIEPLYRSITLDAQSDGTFILYFEKPPHLCMKAWLKELDLPYTPYKNGVLPFTDEEKAKIDSERDRLITEYMNTLRLNQTKDERMAHITEIPDRWVATYRTSPNNKSIQFGFEPSDIKHEDDPLVFTALRKLGYKMNGTIIVYPKTDKERERINTFIATVQVIKDYIYNAIADNIQLNIKTPRKMHRDAFHIQLDASVFVNYNPGYRVMDFIRNYVLHGDKSIVIGRIYITNTVTHITGHVDFSKIKSV